MAFDIMNLFKETEDVLTELDEGNELAAVDFANRIFQPDVFENGHIQQHRIWRAGVPPDQHHVFYRPTFVTSFDDVKKAAALSTMASVSAMHACSSRSCASSPLIGRSTLSCIL